MEENKVDWNACNDEQGNSNHWPEEDPGDSNCLEDEEPKQEEFATGIDVEKCQNMKASLRKSQ